MQQEAGALRRGNIDDENIASDITLTLFNANGLKRYLERML